MFVGRGSHASYYEAGLFQTQAWIDIADGERSAKQTDLIILGDDLPAWALWEGRWGDTEPRIRRVETPSPTGPVMHGDQWSRPGEWAKLAVDPTRSKPANAPPIDVFREKDHVVLKFDFKNLKSPDPPAVILINVNSPGVPNEQPRTFTFNVEDQRAGKIDTSITLVPGQAYVASIAVTSRKGVPSAPLVVPIETSVSVKRMVTARVGAVVQPLIERVRNLFGRGGGGDGP